MIQWLSRLIRRPVLLKLEGADFKEASILTLQPGDTLVLMCDRPISASQAESFKAAVRQKLGEDINVMVLGGGMRFGILRQAS